MAMTDDFVDFIFLVFAAVFAIGFLYMALGTSASNANILTTHTLEDVEIKRDLLHFVSQPKSTDSILQNSKLLFDQQAAFFFTTVQDYQIPNEDGFIEEPLLLAVLNVSHRTHFIKTGALDYWIQHYPESSITRDTCYKLYKDYTYTYTTVNTSEGERYVHYCIKRKNRRTSREILIEQEA